MELKQKVIAEIDSRLDRLEEHHKTKVPHTENQYEELSMALSRILNEALSAELSSLKETIQKL